MAIYRNYERPPVVRKGKLPILFTAPHVTPRGGETNVYGIVLKTTERLGASCVIGRCPRDVMDLNRRTAWGSLYHAAITDMIKSHELHIVIDTHGYSDRSLFPPPVDFATRSFSTGSEQTLHEIMYRFNSLKIPTTSEQYFNGSSDGTTIEFCSELTRQLGLPVESFQQELPFSLRLHPSWVVNQFESVYGNIL